jgi:restriction system protein
MYQGGGQPEWERWQDKQRREDERRREEEAKQAKENHRASQQQAAEERTAAVDRQIRVLDGLLTDSLSVPPLTFRQLKVSVQLPRLDPGGLGVARPEPDWKDFEPVKPTGLSWLFGGAARYEQQMTQARGSFEFAKSQHRREEDRRQRALAAARERYERKVADAQAEVAPWNADIDTRQAALELGDPEAVEWFAGRVLDNSWYPEGFPRHHHVAYRPENRRLVVEFELPPQEVIPKERGYWYVKARDVIEPLPRPESEIRQQYAHVIACITLRTLNELFWATPAEVVTAVLFNGRASGIDRATGKPARPYLHSVTAERPAFIDLELAEVEPMACLKRHFHARVSPNPFDMEAIEPFKERG